MTRANEATKAEVKATKEIFAVAVADPDDFDDLLVKLSYWRTLRVCAWITRFVRNSRSPKAKRLSGPLPSEEIEAQKVLWVIREQSRAQGEAFERDRLQLNLHKNQRGVLECRGRVQGFYPIYLPDTCVLAKELIEHAHLSTLHGGIGLTMTKILATYWIPRLRRLARKVIKECFGCKRFRAIAYSTPPPSNLPTSRTEGASAFQVIGVDYAGPIRYRKSKTQGGKAYILLYSCSFTRGIYLDLLPNMEMSECLDSLERFIARRGRPEIIYSDNGATFVGVANWMKKVLNDERLQDYLARHDITWKFNLSRAPWWGGQFERMVGLVKNAFYKVIGHAQLSWKELQKVILSVEVCLNERPLGYVEDDIQSPILTPNCLLFVRPSLVLEAAPHHVEDNDVRKRYKFILKCKDALWKRWSTEYLRALRERHLNHTKGGRGLPAIGDIVIIKSDNRNRGKWLLGRVDQLITGKDGVVRGAKLCIGKSVIERPVQFLYPVELSCDRKATRKDTPTQELNPEAVIFKPKREAAILAGQRIRELSEEDQDDT